MNENSRSAFAGAPVAASVDGPVAAQQRVRRRTRVKFCGFVRAEDVDTAVALGVDAIGFVFHAPSPRAIDIPQAMALRRRLPSWVQAVGLFVNEPLERMFDTIARTGVDVVQLHGDETPSLLRTVRDRTGRPCWKAVHVHESGDGQLPLQEAIDEFAEAECCLLDTASAGFGGSGRRFDWSLFPRESASRLMLSGGLDAAHVQRAIRELAPLGVDVSSGIQGPDPRRKDASRMEAFLAAVAQADAHATAARSSPSSLSSPSSPPFVHSDSAELNTRT